MIKIQLNISPITLKNCKS